jgi:hypothetical protein
MDVMEIWYEGMDWIYLAQDWDQLLMFVNMEMKRWVP